MRGWFLVVLLLAAGQGQALAWGGKGHRLIGELAMKTLPPEAPAFLKTPEAVWRIGQLAQEPDISRGAGQPHDWDLDPGHFVDGMDDGSILGGPRLDALPPSRRDYDTALRAVGTNQYQAGFLPYNLMGGWQQLVKDFALVRLNRAALKHADRFRMTAAQRKDYARALDLRQAITVHDLGVWSHFVGDASQPLHVSIHYDGWGEGANPAGYGTQKGLHAKFETDFVDAHISQADIAARLTPYRPCACAVARRVQDYLLESWRQVTPLYDLDKAGGFDAPTPDSRGFAAARIAVAASTLRDLVADAWRASAESTLGYKVRLTVADLEAGRADPRTFE